MIMKRKLLPYGSSARLLECTDLADSRAVHAWLDRQRRPEIALIIPGARTLLLQLNAPLPDDFVTELIMVDPPPARSDDDELIMVDVRYDGADLAAVADLLGLGVEDVIAAHTGQDWIVAFCGFAPGFGYLAPTQRPLTVPRLTSPRTSVPAGSVALADNWSAIYPGDSPGGWQLIGRTDLALFDVSADPPATLRPGMRVRFRAVDAPPERPATTVPRP